MLRMFLLAMFSTTNKILLFSGVLVNDTSPKRHKDGESWIGLASAWDKNRITFCQNWLKGVQCHLCEHYVSCILSAVLTGCRSCKSHFKHLVCGVSTLWMILYWRSWWLMLLVMWKWLLHTLIQKSASGAKDKSSSHCILDSIFLKADILMNSDIDDDKCNMFELIFEDIRDLIRLYCKKLGSRHRTSG